MPRWTQNELNAYNARRAAKTDSKRSSPAVVQKPEASSDRPSDRKAENLDAQKGEGANEGTGGCYRLRITVGISDLRKRDLDGMLATILDAFVNARRRLLAGDRGNFNHGSKKSKTVR